MTLRVHLTQSSRLWTLLLQGLEVHTSTPLRKNALLTVSMDFRLLEDDAGCTYLKYVC
jgi:hypothetical protein